jgi:hypothetical protein
MVTCFFQEDKQKEKHSVSASISHEMLGNWPVEKSGGGLHNPLSN